MFEIRNIQKKHIYMCIDAFMKLVITAISMQTIQKYGDLVIFLYVVISLLWIFKALNMEIIEDKYV